MNNYYVRPDSRLTKEARKLHGELERLLVEEAERDLESRFDDLAPDHPAYEIEEERARQNARALTSELRELARRHDRLVQAAFFLCRGIFFPEEKAWYVHDERSAAKEVAESIVSLGYPDPRDSSWTPHYSWGSSLIDARVVLGPDGLFHEFSQPSLGELEEEERRRRIEGIDPALLEIGGGRNTIDLGVDEGNDFEDAVEGFDDFVEE